MNKLILLVCFTMLTGCASIKESICDKPILPAEKIIHVDPKLLESCKPLLESTNSSPSFEDYLLLTGDNAIAYSDCKRKQEDSIKFIKEVSGWK